jgi:Holliday junction DNA helicase RuvB
MRYCAVYVILLKRNGTIDIEIARYALKALNVDAHGLDEMDNKILTTIIEKFKGGPGLTTLATAIRVAKQLRKCTSRFNTRGFHYAKPRGRSYR